MRTSPASLIAQFFYVHLIWATTYGWFVFRDVLTIALDRTVRVLKVTAFNERRGDAASARVLYEDLGEGNPSSNPSSGRD